MGQPDRLSRLMRVLLLLTMGVMVAFLVVGVSLSKASTLEVGIPTSPSAVEPGEYEVSSTEAMHAYIVCRAEVGINVNEARFRVSGVEVQRIQVIGSSEGKTYTSVGLDIPAGSKWQLFGDEGEHCTVSYSSLNVPGGGSEGKEGKEGPRGEFSWKGEWKASTAYSKGDAVFMSGSSYVCIKSMTSGEDVEPPEVTHWEIMAEKGAEGKEGKEGSGGSGGEVTKFGPTAEATLAEGVETLETVGFCIIGTMLALFLGWFTWVMIKPHGTT